MLVEIYLFYLETHKNDPPFECHFYEVFVYISSSNGTGISWYVFTILFVLIS